MNIDPAVQARLRRILEAVPGLAVQRVERPAAARDAERERSREGEPADAIVTLAGQRLPSRLHGQDERQRGAGLGVRPLGAC